MPSDFYHADLRPPPGRLMRGLVVGRPLPDGRHQLYNARGKLRGLAFLKPCPTCQKPVVAAHGEIAPHQCKDCLLAAKCKRAEEFAQQRPMRIARRRAAAINRSQRRHLQQLQAMVCWRDRKKIKAIYRRAREKTAATGRKYEVDHIYPLVSPLCCGLHVHENLRVIARRTNSVKGNGFPLFDSPATTAAMEDGTLIPWIREMRANSTGAQAAGRPCRTMRAIKPV